MLERYAWVPRSMLKNYEASSSQVQTVIECTHHSHLQNLEVWSEPQPWTSLNTCQKLSPSSMHPPATDRISSIVWAQWLWQTSSVIRYIASNSSELWKTCSKPRENTSAMEANEVILPSEHTVMRSMDPPRRQTQTNTLATDGYSPWEVAPFHGVQSALTPPQWMCVKQRWWSSKRLPPRSYTCKHFYQS